MIFTYLWNVIKQLGIINIEKSTVIAYVFDALKGIVRV